MARKIKIDNAEKKRFARKEARRKTNVRYKRTFYLIVCEGTKTEPNYFEAIRDRLERGVVTTLHLEIVGAGKNTESLLDEAIRIAKKYTSETGRLIDQTWIVFDRDSFAPQQFNNAILRSMQLTPPVHTAWTNEAFELWYLLHLIYFDNAIGRTEYQRMLEEQLSSRMGVPFKYEKNSKSMLAHLTKYGSQAFAIENARKLEALWANRQDYANHCPCTKVHHLIGELKLWEKNS